MEPIRIRYELEQRDTAAALFGLFNLRKPDLIRLGAAIGIAVVTLIGVGIAADQKALVVGGIGLVGFVAILFVMVRKTYSDMTPHQRKVRWVFGDDEIEIGNAVESSNVAWHTIEAWRESEDQVYLKLEGALPLVIPKRVLDEEVLFELRTLFHKRIPKGPSSRSILFNVQRLVPVIIVVLLAVVALVAYPALFGS